MNIYITRSSVSAGDDVDSPHKKELTIPELKSVEEIVFNIHKAYTLPEISGGKATWSIVSNIPLAVIAQEWSAPKMLHNLPPIEINQLDVSEGVVRFHLNYHAQIDPNTVFKILERLQLNAY